MLKRRALHEMVDAGLPVFPVTPKTKKPAVAGYLDANPEQRHQWVDSREWRAVGLACTDGRIVLDHDSEPGVWALDELPDDAPTVETARGFHIHMRAPEGVTVRQAIAAWPGCDIKAGPSFVILHSSTHRSDDAIEAFLVARLPLAPAWLVERCHALEKESGAISTNEAYERARERTQGWRPTSKAPREILAKDCAAIPDTPPGEQRDTLNRIAVKWGYQIGEFHVWAVETVARKLVKAAMTMQNESGRPLWTEVQIQAVVEDGLAFGFWQKFKE